MLVTTKQLIEELSKEYKNPSAKIRSMRKNGELKWIKRGLYTASNDIFKEVFSEIIYSPSYVSFEKALSRYNLIPEWVPVCTCATYGEMHDKSTGWSEFYNNSGLYSYEFENDLGRYLYKNIPKEVFPYGLRTYYRGNYYWTMATPEKAICDLLYRRKDIDGYAMFEGFLFEGMRFDEDEFFALDKNLFLELAPMYKVQNLEYLERYVREVM